MWSGIHMPITLHQICDQVFEFKSPRIKRIFKNVIRCSSPNHLVFNLIGSGDNAIFHMPEVACANYIVISSAPCIMTDKVKFHIYHAKLSLVAPSPIKLSRRWFYAEKSRLHWTKKRITQLNNFCHYSRNQCSYHLYDRFNAKKLFWSNFMQRFIFSSKIV